LPRVIASLPGVCGIVSASWNSSMARLDSPTRVLASASCVSALARVAV
jgi:hypothetical protein